MGFRSGEEAGYSLSIFILFSAMKSFSTLAVWAVSLSMVTLYLVGLFSGLGYKMSPSSINALRCLLKLLLLNSAYTK